LVEQAADVDAL